MTLRSQSFFFFNSFLKSWHIHSFSIPSYLVWESLIDFKGFLILRLSFWRVSNIAIHVVIIVTGRNRGEVKKKKVEVKRKREKIRGDSSSWLARAPHLARGGSALCSLMLPLFPVKSPKQGTVYKLSCLVYLWAISFFFLFLRHRLFMRALKWILIMFLLIVGHNICQEFYSVF